jgi:hypothetical protein
MAQGRKKRARTKVRPGNFSFSSRAMVRPRMNFMTVAAAVKTNETLTDCQN